MPSAKCFFINPPIACLGRARVSNRWAVFLLTHPVVFRSCSRLEPVDVGKVSALSKNIFQFQVLSCEKDMSCLYLCNLTSNLRPHLTPGWTSSSPPSVP